MGILLNRDEYLNVRRYSANTILIDCSPIGTTDFGLTEQGKELLLDRGRLGALDFLIKQGWDVDGSAEKERKVIANQAENHLLSVTRERQVARRWRIFLIVLAFLFFLGWMFWDRLSPLLQSSVDWILEHVGLPYWSGIQTNAKLRSTN